MSKKKKKKLSRAWEYYYCYYPITTGLCLLSSSQRKESFYPCTKILLSCQVMYPWGCVLPEGDAFFYPIHAEGGPFSNLHKGSL